MHGAHGGGGEALENMTELAIVGLVCSFIVWLISKENVFPKPYKWLRHHHRHSKWAIVRLGCAFAIRDSFVGCIPAGIFVYVSKLTLIDDGTMGYVYAWLFASVTSFGAMEAHQMIRGGNKVIRTGDKLGRTATAVVEKVDERLAEPPAKGRRKTAKQIEAAKKKVEGAKPAKPRKPRKPKTQPVEPEPPSTISFTLERTKPSIPKPGFDSTRNN